MNTPVTSKHLSPGRITAAATLTADLRILATTDVHMQLLGHDYVSDVSGPNHGLAGIATIIAKARAQAARDGAGAVLLDNGDMIQGSIIGDLAATEPVTDGHPVVSCLNAMRYDAIGLGNHDLDFGLPYLRAIAARLSMPLVSTNLRAQGDPFCKRTALIRCPLPQPGGPPVILKVGVVSVLPAKTAIWNRHMLKGRATVLSAHDSLSGAVAQLRANGADVVILLAHMGVAEVCAAQDDSGASLATLPGIDAVVAGHTHRRFPSQDHAGLSDVDTSRGTIAGRPAVMPGNGASDLAVLDLKLARARAGEWTITEHTSALRANTADTPPDERIASLCLPAHQRAQSYLAKAVGNTDRTLHTYFSLVAPTDIAALTARAKAQVVRSALAGTPDADLPLLASVAAHTAGGRGGSHHYLCVPKGPVLRRHIAGLTPYTNQIWAVRITGTDLRALLENAAAAFHRLYTNRPDQPLIDPTVPAFNFDTLFGVTYAIDPTRPLGQRITQVHHAGRPVRAADRFILATNQFRAAGGGGVKPTRNSDIVLRSTTTISDALIDALNHPGDGDQMPQRPWSFACDGQVQATLKTSPLAIDHLPDIAHLTPRHLDTTPDGFARLRLSL